MKQTRYEYENNQRKQALEALKKAKQLENQKQHGNQKS